MSADRTNQREKLIKWLGLLLMGIFVVLYLVPVFGVVLTSLKTNAEIASQTPFRCSIGSLLWCNQCCRAGIQLDGRPPALSG